MKRGEYIVFDNKGKTYDRYTVIFWNGDVLGASEDPFHPLGFGQYCGNIAHSYYTQSFGIGWQKGHSHQKITAMIKQAVDSQIQIAKNDKDWLGKETKDLPADVQKYILQYITD
jgi:hypothetical protein